MEQRMYTQDDFRNLLYREADSLKSEKFELQKNLRMAITNMDELEAGEVTGLIIKIEKIDFAIYKLYEMIGSLQFKL